MNRHFIRFFAVLIVPCLLADPITVSAVNYSFFSDGRRPATLGIRGDLFQEQAITARLLNFADIFRRRKVKPTTARVLREFDPPIPKPPGRPPTFSERLYEIKSEEGLPTDKPRPRREIDPLSILSPLEEHPDAPPKGGPGGSTGLKMAGGDPVVDGYLGRPEERWNPSPWGNFRPSRLITRMDLGSSSTGNTSSDAAPIRQVIYAKYVPIRWAQPPSRGEIRDEMHRFTVSSKLLRSKLRKRGFDVTRYELQKIERILGHAIFNAIEAIAEFGNGRGVVRYAIVREGPDLVLEIEDNGIGIVPETLDLLMHRYYVSTKSDDGITIGRIGEGVSLLLEDATHLDVRRIEIDTRPEESPHGYKKIYVPDSKPGQVVHSDRSGRGTLWRIILSGDRYSPPGMSGSDGSGTSTGISASGDGLYSLPRGPEKPRMVDVVGPPRRMFFADSGELSRNETSPEESEAATQELIRLSLLEENQRLIEKQVFATLESVSRLMPQDIREALPSRRSLQYAVLMRELYNTFKYGTIFTSSGLHVLKQYIREDNLLINAILDRWRTLKAENLVLRAARLKPPEPEAVEKDFNVDNLWSKPEKGKDWKDSHQWLLQAREALFRKQLQNAAGLLQKVEEALLTGSIRPTLFMQRIREDLNAAQIMLKTLRRSALFQAVPVADVVETHDVLSRVDAVLVKSLSKSIYNYGISVADLVTLIHDPVRVGLYMADRSGMGAAQLVVFVDTIYHAIGGKRKSLEPTVDSPKITPKKPKGKVKPTQPLQIGDTFPGKVISGKVIQIEPDPNYASTPALRIQLKTQHRNGIAMQGGLTIHRLISEFGWPRSLAEITFAFHFPEMQRRNQTKRFRRSA